MKKHLVLKLSQTKCGRLQKPNKKSIFVSLTKDTLSCYKAAYNLISLIVEELLRPSGSAVAASEEKELWKNLLSASTPTPTPASQNKNFFKF